MHPIAILLTMQLCVFCIGLKLINNPLLRTHAQTSRRIPLGATSGYFTALSMPRTLTRKRAAVFFYVLLPSISLTRPGTQHPRANEPPYTLRCYFRLFNCPDLAQNTLAQTSRHMFLGATSGYFTALSMPRTPTRNRTAVYFYLLLPAISLP